jgi:hypothetical protein
MAGGQGGAWGGSAGTAGVGGKAGDAGVGGQGGNAGDASLGGNAGTAGTGGNAGGAGVGGNAGDAGSAGCPADDHDCDGYAPADGDCFDSDPAVNPGAFDDGTPQGDGGPALDVNCDGKVGGDTYSCDDGLLLADGDAFHGAKAIGLCRMTDENATGKSKTWGVISAKYVLADGTPGMNPLSYGLLPKFGQNTSPRQGKVMLGLSSGTARDASMSGYQSPNAAIMGTTCSAPLQNMPTPSCTGVLTDAPKDPAALEVRLRVPTNAKSIKFLSNFYTFEFPAFACGTYADFFVTLMQPRPQGLASDNILFDQDDNPISVNTTLIQACTPQDVGTKYYDCPLGTLPLEGTGFENHGATGWLQTTAPVTPGAIITLRWAVWDSGDSIVDSTVLLDSFRFSSESVSEVSTEPAP